MNRHSAASLLLALAIATGCTSEATGPDDTSLARRSSLVVISATGSVVYDNLPSPFPGNYASLGYQATSTDEFGDGLTLAGTARNLTTVTVGMSSWACESGSWNLNTCSTTPGASFNHPITLNIYKRGPDAPNPTVGALIASKTITAAIPYRPSVSAACTGGDAGKWSNGSACFSGLAFTLEFDFAADGIVLDDQIVVGIAYNTNTHGNAPLGVSGPYESLNVGVVEEAIPASVGANLAGGGFHDVTFFPPNTDSFTWSDYYGYYTPLLRIQAITLATSVEQCKKNGWQSVSRVDGSAFKNQGDCVSYVKNGK